MTSPLTDVLFRPDAFYENVIRGQENLKIPALIILAGGIIAAVLGYLMGVQSATMMAGIMPGMDSIILISAVVGAFLGTFIFWLIVAGLFYIISIPFKGEGSFNRTLEVVGYGYLPQVIGSAITLIAAIEYLPRVAIPALTKSALEDPAMIEAATKALMHDPAMVEFTQIATLIAIVFMLWSANIWIFGMKHARGLSPRDAAICVGVPVVLYVIYVIYTLGAM
jgi:hypothetical protein